MSSAATVKRFGRHVTGIFSNLGVWPPPGSPVVPDLPDHWLFVAPVTLDMPFSAGALTWQGRMSLTVQAHPALSRDPSQARVWSEDWVREILGRSG